MENEELNRKVAAWLGVKWHLTDASSDTPHHFYCGPCGEVHSFFGLDSNPDYTTDANACLELIEAVRAKGPTVDMQALGHGEVRYQVIIWPGNGTEYYGQSDSLPMAVAQAVVKLVEAENEKTV